MEQKMTVVVLSASRYSFDDDKGRNIEGTKVNYFTLDNENEENSVGHAVFTEVMDYRVFANLGAIPGIYEAQSKLVRAGKNLKLKVTDFKFVDHVTFELPVANLAK